MSGFPSRKESDYDAFDTGHASNSISIAVGLAEAKKKLGRDQSIVAVIGDGSLTGGMSFEALNHAGHLKSDIIVMLNDNEMSISKNVGALSVASQQDHDGGIREQPQGRDQEQVKKPARRRRQGLQGRPPYGGGRQEAS